MRPLKRPTYIALIFIISLMSIMFFVGGPDYHSQRSFKALWNIGHLIYFALFPLLLFLVGSVKQLKPIHQVMIIIGLTLVLGVLVELFQYGFDRTPDMADIFRNFIGASIAICFMLPIRKAVPKVPMRILITILIILAGLQFYPMAIALVDEHHASRDFPILSDFQTHLQIHRWTGDAVITVENDIGRKNNQAMRADLTTQLYSGVALKYFPGNWQHYQWFQFRIYNPSKDVISITCRIHDKTHIKGVQQYKDRFNTTHSFPNGWSTITISLDEIRQAPDERQMDLGQIYGVGFFASQLAYPRTIYIDDVRLY